MFFEDEVYELVGLILADEKEVLWVEQICLLKPTQMFTPQILVFISSGLMVMVDG